MLRSGCALLQQAARIHPPLLQSQQASVLRTHLRLDFCGRDINHDGQLFGGAKGGGRRWFATADACCPPPSLTCSLGIMRPTPRKFIWFVAVVVAIGVALDCVLIGRPTVTLSVISIQRASGSPTALCKLKNRGDRPVEFSFHSLDQTPCYHWLEGYGSSWHRALWDMHCGIDLQPRILASGQALSFRVSFVDTNRPARLSVSYRRDGKDFTVCTRTIVP